MTDPVIAPAPGPDSKPVWQSKTAWVALITAVVPIICPACAAWIASNPQIFSFSLGLVFAGLRLLSQGKVSIS